MRKDVKFFLNYYKNSIVLFIVFTTINFGLFCFNIIELDVFLIRQVFILFLVILKNYSSSLLDELTRESDEIKTLVLEKEPRLRFLSFFLIIMVPSLFIYFQELFLGSWIQFLALSIINMWLLFNLYYMYIISTIPQARAKYNIYGAIKKHGFRSSQTAKAAYTVCKECTKGFAFISGSIYFGDKMINGPTHRCYIVNEVGALFNGNFKSQNEFALSAAKYLVGKRPELRSVLVRPDGWIIDEKIIPAATKVGLNIFQTEYIQAPPKTWTKTIFGWFTGSDK